MGFRGTRDKPFFCLRDSGLALELLRDSEFKYLRDSGFITNLSRDTGLNKSRGIWIRSEIRSVYAK